MGGAPIPPAYAPAIAKPPEPDRAAVSHAVAVGTEAASNAAASAEKRGAATVAKEPSAVTGTLSNEPVDLLWLASKALPRVRIFWKGVLADLAFESFDSKHELASGDKRLMDAAAPANELLGRPHPNAGGAATRQLAALREQHLTLLGKAATATAFDAEIERLLVDERAFDERTLFGEKHVVFSLGSGASALPAYAPEAVRPVVPLFEVVRARVIAEIHARQDRSEGAAFALRLVALGRVLELGSPQPFAGSGERVNR